MPIDPSLFEVTRALQKIVGAIKRESATVPSELFAECPHTTLYSEGWRVFPIRIEDWPYPCDFDRNRSYVPETDRVLRDFPQITCAGISRLEPGCRIYPHSDDPPPDVLRGHLCLQGSSGVRMKIGGTTIEWQTGRFEVFDTSEEHEVQHDGDFNRDVLLVDFVLTAAEKRALAASGYEGRLV